MDQFPDLIIETIFSYLMDRKYYFGDNKENFIIINRMRLVCRKFLNLEHYLVSNLVLGMCWTKQVYQLSQQVYRLSQQDHSFWKINLPYVHHLTFWQLDIRPDIDCSIFTHVRSLDIRWGRIEFINYENLTQLMQVFCYKDHNVSKLTKTNIHYHDCDRDRDRKPGYLKYDYGNKCIINECLIRHHDDPF